MTRYTPFHVAAGGAFLTLAFAAVPARAQSAADQAMTCNQIIAAVNDQNAIIKAAQDDKAGIEAHREDPSAGGAADPAIQERKDDIKAQRATTRGNELVALGKTKRCYK